MRGGGGLWEEATASQQGPKLLKEATEVLGRASGNSGFKVGQHAGQAGPGETCVHAERACALQSAGAEAPPYLRTVQRWPGYRAEKGRED